MRGEVAEDRQESSKVFITAGMFCIGPLANAKGQVCDLGVFCSNLKNTSFHFPASSSAKKTISSLVLLTLLSLQKRKFTFNEGKGWGEALLHAMFSPCGQ